MFRFPLACLLAGTAILVAPAAHGANLGGELLDGKGIIVSPGPTAQPLPSVWAKTWIIADAGTGEILAARRAHTKRAPASTIKTLTALTVLPQLPLDATTQAKRQAVRMYGSRVGLKRGRTYTVEELVNAMLLPSANDAAVALAQANGGVGKTVREMNAVAAQLQAVNTTAMNPSGLDAPGMVSTAYDLALIGRAALADPTLAEFLKRTTASFPGKKNKKRTIYTNNRLLLGNYRGAIGVKTGYTSKAGRTFIGAAERNGRTLIVVLMGINERSDVAARKLLDWGFANATRVTPVGTLVDPQGTVPTTGEVLLEGGGEEVTELDAPAALPAVEVSEAAVLPEHSTTWFAVAAGVLVLLVLSLVGFRRHAVARARHAGRS
jgi:D-alanyl-D-alanine carboxypeptidase (penicillin-binding protein 5/6)